MTKDHALLVYLSWLLERDLSFFFPTSFLLSKLQTQFWVSDVYSLEGCNKGWAGGTHPHYSMVQT